ncbi:hypothetical protein ACIPJN_29690 [Streptomyces sp. NPDC086796]|uniref:hypothetical protein n=1 Tax=Streptomyces sp. NPDC086796 TaxID=3365760 RepID=UPI0037FECDF8
MPAVAISGELHAALNSCFPQNLPGWITATAPRCGTGSTTSIDVTAHQEQELADLTALAWWECEQAVGDADPFAAVFAEACARHLQTPRHPG